MLYKGITESSEKRRALACYTHRFKLKAELFLAQKRNCEGREKGFKTEQPKV